MIAGIFNTVIGGAARLRPHISENMDLKVVQFDCPPVLENLDRLEKAGCEALVYASDHMESEAFFRKIADCGVKYICTNSSGYDHLNLDAMRKCGLKGANVPSYEPNAISEHTVMLLLASVRKLRKQILNVEQGCYTRKDLAGKELGRLRIGVVGTGRIGCTTLKCLSGFAPEKLYASDPYENDTARQYAEYLPLETLYGVCDVIIFHTAYNASNHHMVNRNTIAEMKDGVVLINTARGGLFDAQALLEGLASGKVGAAALDVIESEGILRSQPQFEECPLPVLKELLKHDNFIFTSHTAFYTEEADRKLAEGVVRNLEEYLATGSCRNELVL